jgi:large subunit ribosomal protein L22
MIEAQATARYVRTSAQKAGLVLDLIRGRDVNQALATLRFARKRVAQDIEKVLRSAIANAQQREGFSGDVDRLFVSACYAGQGPSMKRVRPAPMGRAFRVLKRTAHLTVHVAERPATSARVASPRSRGGAKKHQGEQAAAGPGGETAGAPRVKKSPAAGPARKPAPAKAKEQD